RPASPALPSEEGSGGSERDAGGQPDEAGGVGVELGELVAVGVVDGELLPDHRAAEEVDRDGLGGPVREADADRDAGVGEGAVGEGAVGVEAVLAELPPAAGGDPPVLVQSRIQGGAEALGCE